MRKRVVASGMVFALLMLLGLGVWPHHNFTSAKTNQEADKIIQKEDEYAPPVKIILVGSKIGIIETDTKIAADDDWLRGLAVRVRNDSDKPVSSVSVYLQFCRPENQAQQPDFIAPLEYGPRPLCLSRTRANAPR